MSLYAKPGCYSIATNRQEHSRRLTRPSALLLSIQSMCPVSSIMMIEQWGVNCEFLIGRTAPSRASPDKYSSAVLLDAERATLLFAQSMPKVPRCKL